MPRFARSTLQAVLFVLALTSVYARGQTGERELAARLKGKPLYLRGFWADNHLRFDLAGQPLARYRVATFTLAGMDVYRVKLKKDGLEISGQRMGLEFPSGLQVKRVPLTWPGYDGDLHLFIQGKMGDDFGPALDVILAPDLASLLPSLPTSWEIIGTRMLHTCSPNLAASAPAPCALPQGMGLVQKTETPSTPGAEKPKLRPPRVLSQVEPKPSQAATELHYGNPVEVYLWVDTNGVPSHLRVIRPAGLGLDEEALESVAQYKFAPATLNDRPVKVDLYFEVDFGPTHP